MLTWVLIIAAVVAALFWLLAPAQAFPNPLNRPSALGDALALVLQRGVAGATVTIALRDAIQSGIVFNKYITSDRVGLTSALALDLGPEDVYQSFRDDLRQRGIGYRERTVDGHGGTIEIDCGTDIELAQVVTRLTFQRIFDTSVERDGVALFKKVVLLNLPPHLTGPPGKKKK